MAKELVENVEVGGEWFGPSYPDAKVTAEVAEKITNPAAYGEETPEPEGPEGYTIDGPAEAPEPEPQKLIGESDDAPAAQTAEGVEVPPVPEPKTTPDDEKGPNLLLGESDDAPAAKTASVDPAAETPAKARAAAKKKATSASSSSEAGTDTEK